MQPIGISNITLGFRGGEYGDRYYAELLVVLDLPENVSGIRFREIEVQKDEVRARSVLKLALTPQKLKSFFTVSSNVNRDRQLEPAQRLAYQAYIAGVVFDN